jgi:TetR/AcrR family transcriptional regulator, copper-responsive repressor
MVQKSSKRRGRPPSYVPEVALARATDAFWKAGYAATSLDELAAATGMNRPSLYGAFGDKHALYLKALADYWEVGRATMARALAPERPLRDGLRRVYSKALDLYFPPENTARGCFIIGTATTEAMHDVDVRTALAAVLHDIDAAFEARLRFAQQRGELRAGADPLILAKLAGATLHTLAIRSRAGEPRAELEAISDGVVELICGRAPPNAG